MCYILRCLWSLEFRLVTIRILSDILSWREILNLALKVLLNKFYGNNVNIVKNYHILLTFTHLTTRAVTIKAHNIHLKDNAHYATLRLNSLLEKQLISHHMEVTARMCIHLLLHVVRPPCLGRYFISLCLIYVPSKELTHLNELKYDTF